MKFVCILTTAPNLSVARKISDGLLQNKLAACVNLIFSVESRYAWKGKLEKSREVQLVIKTRASLFKKIEVFFKKSHPYEVPEFIQLSITRGSEAYLKWIQTSTIFPAPGSGQVKSS